jgi:hypothetical protein
VVGARTATALVGVLASLAVSAALWYYFETFLFFLFVPFVPFLLRRADPNGAGSRPDFAECPVCGYRTADPEHDYCPRDGTRLERGGEDVDRRG